MYQSLSKVSTLINELETRSEKLDTTLRAVQYPSSPNFRPSLWIESQTEVENNLASHSIHLQTTTKALVRMVASTALCGPSLRTKPQKDSGKARISTLRKESEKRPGVPSLSFVRSCDLEGYLESKANSLGNVLDDLWWFSTPCPVITCLRLPV